MLTSKDEDAAGHSEAVRILLYSFGCIIENWVQTQFIPAAQNVHQMGRQHFKLTRYCLIYMALMNLSEWIQLASYRQIAIQSTYEVNPVMNKCFGEATTNTLFYLFYPLLELYRFHTVVVAYEIY